MKTVENMTMSQRANFQEEVRSYLNDNLSYITPLQSTNPEELAHAILEHYIFDTENIGEAEHTLSADQRKEFLLVAERYMKENIQENS